MKSLQTIQKTFQVFGTLSKIAMILSFVWAGLAAIGLLCVIVWQTGGNVVGIELEHLLELTETTALTQMIGVLLADLIFALTDGTLFAFAMRYFKAEQTDGTPFTTRGADQIRNLGIKTIVMPLVAVVLGGIMYSIFDVTVKTDWSNGGSIIIGIVLILASLVFRYGAELEDPKL